MVFPPDVYLAEAWKRFQSDKAAGRTLVCRGGNDQTVGQDTYRKAWSRACKKVGVSMPMYALRHIAASEMLSNGADIAAVAAQLGHKDITTTGVFYTHALVSSQRRAAMSLPACPNLVHNGAEK